MKNIVAILLLLFLSGIAHAEQSSSVPQPIPRPTSPITLDEYGKLPLKEEKERLKAAAEQIKEYRERVANASVPIIYYGDKCSALKVANRAKDYLVKTGVIESDQIFTVYGGAGRELSIRIYLIPAASAEIVPNTDPIAEPDCPERPKKPSRRASRRKS